MTETLAKPLTATEPEANAIAMSWLQALASRGVTVTLRNNRLWLHPASAHRALSDDEVLVLRHHRHAIKDAIKAGISLDVKWNPPAIVRAAPIVEKPPPAPEPPCPGCGRSPCIGDDHPAFFALHPEAAQAREDARVHKEFRLYFGMDPWPR